jgi:antitoxin HicB
MLRAGMIGGEGQADSQGAFRMTKLRTYRVVLEWDEEGPGWVVTVPALPGCVTQGDDEAEALSNAQEAIRCHIEGLLKDGEPLPPPDAEAPMVTVLTPA